MATHHRYFIVCSIPRLMLAEIFDALAGKQVMKGHCVLYKSVMAYTDRPTGSYKGTSPAGWLL